MFKRLLSSFLGEAASQSDPVWSSQVVPGLALEQPVTGFDPHQTDPDAADARREQTVLLHRIPREPGMDWQAFPSWLGGLPRMGEVDWPRNPHDNEPLTFVAQIDLTQLRKTGMADGFPKEGALAFFVETDLSTKIDNEPYPQVTGRVIHVTGQAAETSPPADAPPLDGPDWNYYARWSRTIEDAPRVFPRAPVELLPAEVSKSHPTKDAMQFLGDRLRIWHDMRMPGFPARETLSWHLVRMMLDDLERCVDQGVGRARHRDEKTSEKISARNQAFLKNAESEPRALLSKWRERLAKVPPESVHEPLPASDFAAFDADLTDYSIWAAAENFHPFGVTYIDKYFARPDRTPLFPDRHGFHGVMKDGWLWMVHGSETDYLAVPEDFRSMLTSHPEKPEADMYVSRMLGGRTDVQDIGEAFADHVLLLQLDSHFPFQWGDMGVINYWIFPDDLAAGRFDAVKVTFEGH